MQQEEPFRKRTLANRETVLLSTNEEGVTQVASTTAEPDPSLSYVLADDLSQEEQGDSKVFTSVLCLR